jgi:hypothetical protein
LQKSKWKLEVTAEGNYEIQFLSPQPPLEPYIRSENVSDPEVNYAEDVPTGEVADHEQCQSDVDVSPPFKSEAACQ